MSRILLTGGAGFIGSHVGELLHRDGHELIVVDDLSTGRQENLIFPCKFVKSTVTEFLENSPSVEGFDYIIHLAATASVEVTEREIFTGHFNNLTSVVKIMEALSGVSKNIPLIFASSAAVYGNSAPPLVKVGYPEAPISFYGLDKLNAEKYIEMYCKKFNKTASILRFFNVYGDRQNKNSIYSGVITKFVDLALSGQSINIYGDGLQTRDFVHVSDVARAVRAAMHRVKSDSADRMLKLNIATGKETRIIDLFGTISQAANYSREPKFSPRAASDIIRSSGDPVAMRDLLEGEDLINIYDGLGSFVAASARSI